MLRTDSISNIHPSELELADLLSGNINNKQKVRIHCHLAICDECLKKLVSAHESVTEFNKYGRFKKMKDSIFKKMNPYLLLAIASFLASFAISRYFMQFLIATVVLGIKWVVDSKTAKMLIMIYDAWKSSGEKSSMCSIRDFERKSGLKY